jgi:dipeptidyl-peptidase 4
MKKILVLILGFAFATATFLNGAAQQNSKQKLTLEDLYKNNVFRQKGINEVRWMKDNKGYSALETNETIGGKRYCGL